MELVYLWVEDYKNIHKQGFNFSSQFHCEFFPEYEKDEKGNEKLKENCKLEIKENKDYISDFFSENINVTAIVGKNGSGKSSLLELVINLESIFTTTNKVFFIVQKDEDLVLYRININHTIKCVKTNIKQQEIKRGVSKKESAHAIKAIGLNFSYMSMSPFLNNLDALYNTIDDKKLLATMFNYRDDYMNKTFNYIGFYLSMVPKIPYLLQHKYAKELFDIQGKPRYLRLEFNRYFKEYFSTFLEDKLKYFEELETTNSKLIYQVLLTNRDAIKVISEISKLFEGELGRLQEESMELKLRLKKEEKKGFLPEPSKPLKTEFDKNLDELYNKPYGNSDKESVQAQANRMTKLKISKYNKRVSEINDILEKIGTIEYNLVQNKNGDVFHFSSGELALLFYFEKVLYMTSKKEDLILLIDESELYMHPDWQKKFLLLLNNLFDNSNFKRQIIISTHSPFLLSDLPKENVIFLEKGEQVYPFKDNEQTFGANIHTLLSHGFFMDDGLMGEFAKGKINSLIQYLKPHDERKSADKQVDMDDTTAQKLIDMIGEPVLQKTLQSMLDEKIYPKESKLDKLKRQQEKLEKEIKKLEDKSDEKS